MADDHAIAAPRLAAATQGVCRHRCAMLGVATCSYRQRQCPWPGSCEQLANAALQAAFDFERQAAGAPDA
jgi:hypothetical protein